MKIHCTVPFRIKFIQLVVIFILLFSSGFSFSQNFDINLLRDININRNTSLDPVFKGFTYSVAPIVLTTPVILFSAGYFRDEPKLKRNAIVTGIGVITAYALSTTLKYSINRPRPFVTYPDIQKATKTFDPSFPSGHTTSAFALATALSLNYPKWYVIVPSYSWAITVAYSRMHLGVHYPSDVLVGILIGIGSSFLCYKINEKFMADPVNN